jgi:hypothetical protein
MRHSVTISVGALILAFSLALTVPNAAADNILSFDTMVGVTGPFTGAANAIRGVPGGGLPWDLEGAKGELDTEGNLKIDVFGLVLADDPRVPVERRLMNPQENFRAIVSCLTIDELDPTMVVTVNVMTGLFPTGVAGDATIEEMVMLPHPCFAPIIFVTSPTGSWFSVTGH